MNLEHIVQKLGGINIPPLEPSLMEVLDFNREMQLIDERYRAESVLLDAIADGDEYAAIAAFYAYALVMQKPLQKATPTSADPLRDYKNSVMITNTLFRKAIERNHVHPIYIHHSSSRLGVRIEQAQTEQELNDLMLEMVKTYCKLVKEYSLAPYSAPVQKAILYIDLNLCSPISTRDIAADQFISPNYLSTRFKEEVGDSISNYLLKRRINMACALLKTSSLSIQDLAAKVGIPDASYFSKQFKRITGTPPVQYQKEARRDSRSVSELQVTA